MQKLLIPFLVFFLIINFVAAEELRITLVTYNPEKKSAEIRIENTGSRDYHDLRMYVDRLPPERIVGLLRQGNAIKIPKGIPIGKHTIIISTAEGINVTKVLDFAKSETQIKDELEIKKKIDELKGGKEEKKVAENVYEIKKHLWDNILIIIIGVVLFLFLLYFMSRLGKGRRKRK